MESLPCTQHNLFLLGIHDICRDSSFLGLCPVVYFTITDVKLSYFGTILLVIRKFLFTDVQII